VVVRWLSGLQCWSNSVGALSRIILFHHIGDRPPKLAPISPIPYPRPPLLPAPVAIDRRSIPAGTVPGDGGLQNAISARLIDASIAWGRAGACVTMRDAIGRGYSDSAVVARGVYSTFLQLLMTMRWVHDPNYNFIIVQMKPIIKPGPDQLTLKLTLHRTPNSFMSISLVKSPTLDTEHGKPDNRHTAWLVHAEKVFPYSVEHANSLA